MRRLSCVVAVGLGLCAAAAGAVDPAAERRVERERITQDQAAVEATFSAAQAACQRQFIVSSCVESARAERRRRLEPLRQQRMLLDADERKERAGQRLQGIEEKQLQLAARAASTPASGGDAAPADVGRRPASNDRPHSPPRAAAASDGGARRQAERRAEGQRIQVEEARAHRASVERRNAERAARKKPAPSLSAAGSAPSPGPAPAVPSASAALLR